MRSAPVATYDPDCRHKAARPSGTIEGFFGLLAGRTKKVATLKEIGDATAQGWAGQE